MFKFFILYHLRRIRRYFQTKRVAKIVTAFLFMAISLAVAGTIYFFFVSGFRILSLKPELRDALSLYSYEIFLLVIGYLVIFSSAISALFGFFRKESNEWLMASPKFKSFFYYIYLRVFILSLWPLFVMAVPVLLAIMSVFKLSVLALVIGLLGITLMTAFVVSLTIAVIFLLTQTLARLAGPAKTKFSYIALILFALFLFSLYLGWHRVGRVSVSDILYVQSAQNPVVGIEPVLKRFSIFPSSPAAKSLLSLQKGDFLGASSDLIPLFAFFLAAAIIVSLESKWHLSLWQIFGEGRFENRALGPGRALKTRTKKFPRYFSGPIGAVFEKEGLIMFRSVRNMLWLGFLLTIWLIQTSLNLLAKSNAETYNANLSSVFSLVQAIQAATVVYFIASFVLRFAFPSFSMEKKTAWIIASAPLSLSSLFWAKFLFYGVIFGALGVLTGVLNAFALPFSVAGSLFVFIAAAIIFLTALGITLGALFPNFETDDPETLSTTLPGLAFIMLAFLYGAGGAWIIYNAFASGTPFALLLFEAASLIGAVILSVIGARSLKRVEFVAVR